MNETTIAIGLELDYRNGALSGRITRPEGETAEFRGWVGLIAALDGLVCADGDASRDHTTEISEGVLP